MKKLLILIVFNLSFYTSFASRLILIKNVSDSTHIDSIYQSLLKVNLDTYVGKSLDFFLNHLEFKDYKIGYHEEPTLRLDHITISYGLDIALNIYFNHLKYIPRYSRPISEREWMNNNMVIREKVGKIELVNYSIKPYPLYIKISKKRRGT